MSGAAVEDGVLKNFYYRFAAQFWRNRYLFLLLTPIVVWYIVFRYVPIAGSVIAFKDYKYSRGIWGSAWVGLKHFRMLFQSPEFFRIFRNTVLISIYKLVFAFPAPIALALMLNEVKVATYKRAVQTVTYIPYFISWVVYGGLVATILSPTYGMVNTVMRSLGLKPIFFMADPRLFRSLLVVTSILKESGWGAIIYLAAIAGIDPQLYEAAIVDGANKWQQMWHITLPGISSTVVVLLIIRIGYLLDVGFEQIFVMYNPTVYEVADVIETYTYRVGILQGRFAFTTALGLFKSVLGFCLVIIANQIARKISGGERGIW
ncbi:MAG: ABC transporter permease [bacterium]